MTKIAALPAFVLASLVVASPAFAMKGIDAARQCEARPDCHVTYRDDGSIFIEAVGGGIVECEGPKRECIVLTSKGVPGVRNGDIGAVIAPRTEERTSGGKKIEKEMPRSVAPAPSPASGPDSDGKPSSNNGLGGSIKKSSTGPMAPNS
jgi:hypothetical protein